MNGKKHAPAITSISWTGLFDFEFLCPITETEQSVVMSAIQMYKNRLRGAWEQTDNLINSFSQYDNSLENPRAYMSVCIIDLGFPYSRTTAMTQSLNTQRLLPAVGTARNLKSGHVSTILLGVVSFALGFRGYWFPVPRAA